MTNQQITAWAEGFWRRAGRIEPFPRSLESTIAWTLPLAVVKLPKLGLSELHRWLGKMDIPFHCEGGERRLRACLLAAAGRGIVFLDGSDPEDEQRFSLAHEVVHFVCDYLEPRERVLALFGESGREVIEGRRPPTYEERLRGVLSGVTIGIFTHLMERSESGDIDRFDVFAAEDRAERLALELLAPRETALKRIEERVIQWHDSAAFDTAAKVLVQNFGLPSAVAVRYGRMLAMSRRAYCSFREWLQT